MAILERVVTYKAAFNASDAATHAINTFPVIAAGTSVLITRVFVSSTAVYGTNTTSFIVASGGDQKVFQAALTSDASIIYASTNPIVLNAASTLKYVFNNANPGNITITIFYRLIPDQNEPDTALIFNRAIVSSAAASFTLYTNALDVPVFIKSLTLYNNDGLAQTFNLILTDVDAVDYNLRTANIATITTAVNGFIAQDGQFFLLPLQVLKISKSGASSCTAYLSYYYDPLYI